MIRNTGYIEYRRLGEGFGTSIWNTPALIVTTWETR